MFSPIWTFNPWQKTSTCVLLLLSKYSGRSPPFQSSFPHKTTTCGCPFLGGGWACPGHTCELDTSDDDDKNTVNDFPSSHNRYECLDSIRDSYTKRTYACDGHANSIDSGNSGINEYKGQISGANHHAQSQGSTCRPTISIDSTNTSTTEFSSEALSTTTTGGEITGIFLPPNPGTVTSKNRVFSHHLNIPDDSNPPLGLPANQRTNPGSVGYNSSSNAHRWGSYPDIMKAPGFEAQLGPCRHVTSDTITPATSQGRSPHLGDTISTPPGP